MGGKYEVDQGTPSINISGKGGNINRWTGRGTEKKNGGKI